MVESTEGRIFLSYRREDSAHVAGRLADRLIERFGGARVFMDVVSVEPGVDFLDEIRRAVDNCDVLLALIGPHWLDVAKDGRRRLDDPYDVVTLEIREALTRGVRVIPVLSDGARMPDREQLPTELAGLTRRNASRVNHETFQSDTDRLLAAVERVVRAAPAVEGPPGITLEVVEYQARRHERRPDRLFGRDELISATTRILRRRKRVLLYGMAGAGKTAIAATVADRYADAIRRVTGSDPVTAWLEVGNATAETVLDALIRRYARERDAAEIRAGTATQRRDAITALLTRSPPSVLVLDDAWNGAALRDILKAIPTDLPVIVTSWKRLGMEDAVAVRELTPEASAALLSFHSGQPAHGKDPAALRLCEFLGHHAMSLEIAGRYLRFYRERTPDQLLLAYADHPDELKTPGEWSQPGRDSVRRLLGRSFEELPAADAREVFLAFGAFPTAGASPQLLVTYLESRGFDEPRVDRALDDLVMFNLVTRATTGYCTMHGLTHSYASARFASDCSDWPDAIGVIHCLLNTHATDHRLLEAEMGNLIGVADRARAIGHHYFTSLVETLARGVLDGRYPLPFLPLLDAAINQTRDGRPDASERLHYLLAKRGNAHDARGEFSEAAKCYREALGVTADRGRRVVLTALVGKELAKQGQLEEAASWFTEANALVDPDDPGGQASFVYEQQSHAAAFHGDYTTARDIAARGVTAARRADNPLSESYSLCNLGSSDFHLGMEAALKAHHEALNIAVRIGNEAAQATCHHAIGIDHHGLEEFQKAQTHLTQALDGYTRLGHVTSARDLEIMMRQFAYITS